MELLLTALALVAFGLGLRSFDHPVLRKLAGVSFLGAFGIALYDLTGNWAIAVGFALCWPLLIHPWLAILTQVRPLRLPLDRTLRMKRAPNEEEFPPLGQLTSEIEQAGFEHLSDTGWDWDDFSQFFRLFFEERSGTQAWICVNNIHEMTMCYVTLTTRRADGKTWITTNDYWTSTSDVFSYGMVTNPHWRVHRFVGAQSFVELLDSHRKFLRMNQISEENASPADPSEMMEQIEADRRRQLRHNLAIGVLVKATENEVRYSLKGMLFLWGQALRDIVRLT
jgi:hypothetical protein